MKRIQSPDGTGQWVIQSMQTAPRGEEEPEVIEERVLRKIRGLQMKAEDTPFEEEAAAMLAKAEQMKAKHHVRDHQLWPQPLATRIKLREGRFQVPGKWGSPARTHKVYWSEDTEVWHSPCAPDRGLDPRGTFVEPDEAITCKRCAR